MTIRPTRLGELTTLRAIERAAGRVFAEIGMDAIADDEPISIDALAEHHRAGLAWVHVDASDRAIAYLIAMVLDSCLHVEQVSVHPDHAGRGIGRGLIEHAASAARAARIPALTLTTFDEVPWNRPYYERLGFRVLRDGQLTPGLVRIRMQERRGGLDRWPRVCMRRDVEPGA